MHALTDATTDTNNTILNLINITVFIEIKYGHTVHFNTGADTLIAHNIQCFPHVQ